MIIKKLIVIIMFLAIINKIVICNYNVIIGIGKL